MAGVGETDKFDLSTLWKEHYGDPGNFSVPGHWSENKKFSWKDLEALKGNKLSVVRDEIEKLQQMIVQKFRDAPDAKKTELKTSVLNPDVLAIEYVALKKNLILPGALATFSDNFAPRFNKENVYGRMDPIATYQGTTRTIEFAWTVNIVGEGKQLGKLQAAIGDLAKFMYPVYQDANYNKLGTGTMVAPPLLRFKVGSAQGGNLNLMKNTRAPAPEKGDETAGFYSKPLTDGLLGIVDSFQYLTFVTGMRGGELNVTRMLDADGNLALVPTHVEIKFGITVLHQDGKVGWTWGKNDEGDATISFAQGTGYPYGYGTTLADISSPLGVGCDPLTMSEAELEKCNDAAATITGDETCE